MKKLIKLSLVCTCALAALSLASCNTTTSDQQMFTDWTYCNSSVSSGITRFAVRYNEYLDKNFKLIMIDTGALLLS